MVFLVSVSLILALIFIISLLLLALVFLGVLDVALGCLFEIFLSF
jgi:hypothetical protein